MVLVRLVDLIVDQGTFDNFVKTFSYLSTSKYEKYRKKFQSFFSYLLSRG